MTDAELDQRITALANDAQKLCADLEATEPSLEQAVAFGALAACSSILTSLAATRLPEDEHDQARG